MMTRGVMRLPSRWMQYIVVQLWYHSWHNCRR